MFYECSALKTLYLSNFDTRAVEDMSGMFNQCTSLISLDLSNFDTNNVKTMGWMFTNCKCLSNITLPINFGQNTGYIDMYGMFNNCTEIFTKYNLEEYKNLNPKIVIKAIIDGKNN